MKPEPKAWLDRFPVLDEDHHADLEARAAVNELRGKMPREQAEAHAHADYVKERAFDAAAHHLLGVKAAHAAQHTNAAKQHGAAYAAAMTAAGADPFEQPPQAVLDRIKDAKQKVYSFKAHPADAFFPVPQEETKDPLQKSLDRLLDLKREILEKSEPAGPEITFTQHGQFVRAEVPGRAAVVTQLTSAGGYSVIHDGIKNHPQAEVRAQHEQVLKALKKHVESIGQV